MSIGYDHNPDMRAVKASRRRILIAPLGEFTRYRLRSHLQHIMIVAVALDIIALTLDLSRRFVLLMEQIPDAGGFGATLHVLWYMCLRSTEVMSQLLPVACFLGILWSEINHTWTRERLMIWNCGRSPVQCLAPALLCGLLMCGIQFFLDIYLRPAVIAYQISHRIGDVGDSYERKKTGPTWISAGTDLIYGRVDFNPPELSELTIFRLDTTGQIKSVVNASTAVPGRTLGEWILRNGTRWDAEVGAQPGAPDYGRRKQPPSPEGLELQFAEQTIDLTIDPLWLNTRGIPAWHLPQSIVLALANAGPGYHEPSRYQTWGNARYSRPVFSLAMVLLAAVLAMLLLTYTSHLQPFLIIIVIGYCMHTLFRIMMVIGEFNYITPAVAAWMPPALILTISAAMLMYLERERLSAFGIPLSGSGQRSPRAG